LTFRQPAKGVVMIKAMRAAVKQMTPPLLYRGMAGVTHCLARKLGPARGWGERPAVWYDDIYRSSREYGRHYTQSRYYALWSVVADRLMCSGAKRILELGCGPGQFARLLADKGITEYCGLDFSAAAVETARALCPAFEFHATDIRQEGVLESLEYDCCLALEFLEHVENDTEILRRLRQGSRFYATVPNFADTAHVRHFTGVPAIEARYGECFSEYRVDPHRANGEGLMFFLIEARIR
jgi:SAM-dependent methyltransferase